MAMPDLSGKSGYGEQFDVEGLSFFRRLLAAIQNGEFVVYFQPKVSISDLSVAGAEALVRWNDNGEIVPPIKFIPFCERTGLVIDIDFYVLEETCRRMREWMDKGIDLVRISVNFSKYHFNEPGIAERIYKVIRSYGIPTEYIEVEFTETAYLDKEELLEYTVDKLKSYGIKSSIDDFGSGYSSLNLLQNMDFEVVKLDKSLLGKGVENGKARKVISSIIHMAKELGMEVLAEGVETPEELKLLRDLNCDVVQGFLFDRPLPVDAFEKRLRKKVYPAGYFGVDIEKAPKETLKESFKETSKETKDEYVEEKVTLLETVIPAPVVTYVSEPEPVRTPEPRTMVPPVQPSRKVTVSEPMFEKQYNKYETNIPEEKPAKRGMGLLIVGIVLCFIALSVLAVVIIWSGRERIIESNEPVATVSSIPEQTTFTKDQVDAMVKEAQIEAGAVAAFETEEEYLDLIHEATSYDGGTINLLKSLFPDEVVFADGSRYVYVPINPKLKLNTLDRTRFTKNEETGFMYYTNPDGEVVSHVGIDVSRHQGVIDWKAVKESGIEFAIIKCGIRGYGSEGNFAIDTMFTSNIEGALEAGLEVGVYFVTQAVTVDEAVEEAEWVLDLITPYDIKGPVAIDVEYAAADERTKDLTAEERSTNIIYFCDTIKAAGYTPLIYSNTKYFIRKMDMSMLENYGKWYANYNSLFYSEENMSIWQFNDPLYFPYEISVWQYTATGKVPGVPVDADLNIIFDKWW